MNLDESVSVVQNGATVFEGTVPRTISAVFHTLSEREDPAATFAAELLLSP